MNTQRRGTTPPHNRVRAVTNSLRVESPSKINDFFSQRRRDCVFRRLIHGIRAALPCLHLSCPARGPALRFGAPGTGLVLF
jgi:hypothetical protein